MTLLYLRQDSSSLSKESREGGASPLEVLARIGLKGDVSNARKTDVFDKLETGEDCAIRGMRPFVALEEAFGDLICSAGGSGASESDSESILSNSFISALLSVVGLAGLV